MRNLPQRKAGIVACSGDDPSFSLWKITHGPLLRRSHQYPLQSPRLVRPPLLALCVQLGDAFRLQSQ